MDQQDPEPFHIKKEEEEFWTSQEEEQLDGQKQTDVSRFSFICVTVKSEDDEEKPQSPQLQQIKTEDDRETELLTSSSAEQMKTETDGEDCGGPEPARNPDPNSHLQPNTDEKASDSSETEVSDDDYSKKSSDSEPEADSDKDWKQTMVPESGVKHDVISTKKSFSCSECGKQFPYKHSLKRPTTLRG